MFHEWLLIWCRAGFNSKRIGIDQFIYNSIPELEQELHGKRFGTRRINWNWKSFNWIVNLELRENLIFVMLWRICFAPIRVLLGRQWCLAYSMYLQTFGKWKEGHSNWVVARNESGKGGPGANKILGTCDFYFANVLDFSFSLAWLPSIISNIGNDWWTD